MSIIDGLKKKKADNVTENEMGDTSATYQENETSYANSATIDPELLEIGIELTAGVIEEAPAVLESVEDVVEEISEAGGGFMKFISEIFDADDETPIGVIIAVIGAIVFAVGGIGVGIYKFTKGAKKK